MPTFKRAIIKFGKPEIELSIWFKQPNQFGAALNDVYEKWAGQTRDYTAGNLVKYINDKMPGCAYTDDQFNNLKEKKTFK